ncbi:MAG: diacylglyceryl transferase [Flavobacterium sp. BFFFF2]|nr:MAG: diacylglyceryl transferase [Flavobacterium sp. BFFFF2]
MKYLKQKWQITSNAQLMRVLIVFAVTGSTTAKGVQFLLATCPHLMQVNKPVFWYYLSYLILLLAIYQILLLSFAFLLGEWRFFWAFEKRMWRFLSFNRSYKKN